MATICVDICFNPVHSGLRRDVPLTISELDPNKSASKLVRAVLRGMLFLNSEDAHQEIKDNNFQLIKCHCNSSSRESGLGTSLDMNLTLKELGITNGDSVSVKKVDRQSKMARVDSVTHSQTSQSQIRIEEIYSGGIEKRASIRQRNPVDYYRASDSSSIAVNLNSSLSTSLNPTKRSSSSTTSKKRSHDSISSTSLVSNRQAQVTADDHVIGCRCALGDIETMVACDSCELWYHTHCIDGFKSDLEKWFCKSCLNLAGKLQKKQKGNGGSPIDNSVRPSNSHLLQPSNARLLQPSIMVPISKDQVRTGCGCLVPNGKMIRCDECLGLFHFTCVGITSLAPEIEWFCGKCKSMDRSAGLELETNSGVGETSQGIMKELMEAIETSRGSSSNSRSTTSPASNSTPFTPFTSPGTSLGELIRDDLILASSSKSTLSKTMALNKLNSFKMDLQKILSGSQVGQEVKDELLKQVNQIEKILAGE